MNHKIIGQLERRHKYKVSRTTNKDKNKSGTNKNIIYLLKV
jgi:hypothetical protein